MIPIKYFFRNFYYSILLLVFFTNSLYGQNDETPLKLKNQIATNLALPFFGSFDLSYERAIANKWALGISGGLYGDRISELSTENSYNRSYDTNYEIMPYARLYFSGNQKKSHFMELLGSISQVDESGGFIRTTNTEGFGVYELGTTRYTAGGLGMGYGYRFLLLNNKLVLEAQFGIRTNFNTNFLFLNVALVRTGIRVGYRF